MTTMISLSEAIRKTLEMTSRLPVESVPLSEASGRILAEEVATDIDMPPFDKSSMDGFALRAHDCAKLPATLEVAGQIPAGTYPDFQISKGQAAGIMTGAPMPDGADSVQQVEKTQSPTPTSVSILEPVRPGQNVARRGEIMTTGQRVLASGVRISAAVVGLLATVGKYQVQVYRRPTVAILVTGDELVGVDEIPGPGQIRNSNGYALCAQVLAAGAIAETMGVAADERDELREKIRIGLECDVLILSGGVSMGEYDFVAEALTELGTNIHYNKVRVKPGKPTVFGHRGDTLVFGLPGNPVSASTIFELIARPALRKMMGFAQFQNLQVEAVLDGEFVSKTNRAYFHPAHTCFRDGAYHTTPLQTTGSADIWAFARSNSYVIAPPEQDYFEVSQKVGVLFHGDSHPANCEEGSPA